MLIFAMPFIVGLVILTKITSRGPGIYRQTRVGLRGEVFTVYKIRTMANDAESKSGPVWTSGVSDPRVTALGRFMRSSHLDELPQLFNVLKGEMALIGPRPERPEFTHFLAQEIPGYVGRLSVKPGITGLAQIVLPADSDLESVRKKLALDLTYVQGGTLILDFKIAMCTAIKMIGLRSSDAANWIGVLGHNAPMNGSPSIGASKNIVSSEATQKNVRDSHMKVQRSVSLDELIEGVSSADQKTITAGEGAVDDTLGDDLVADQVIDSGRTGDMDDPDSGSMGTLPK